MVCVEGRAGATASPPARWESARLAADVSRAVRGAHSLRFGVRQCGVVGAPSGEAGCSWDLSRCSFPRRQDSQEGEPGLAQEPLGIIPWSQVVLKETGFCLPLRGSAPRPPKGLAPAGDTV